MTSIECNICGKGGRDGTGKRHAKPSQSFTVTVSDVSLLVSVSTALIKPKAADESFDLHSQRRARAADFHICRDCAIIAASQVSHTSSFET